MRLASRRPRPAIAATAAAVGMLLALTACSTGGKVRSVASPRSSPTSSASESTAPTPSAPSPATAPAGPSRGVLSRWTSCESGFQCATLTVPLDDTRPGLGTVALALTRHRATGSGRIGSLLVNPGGPGASAVEFLQSSYTDFPAEIRKHFDLVAFDPRGVGRTAPVRCETTPELDAYFHLDPVPDTAAELRALDAGNLKLAQGCQRRSARILPYVSTAVVAQDMDRVRQAVGDAKLTYLGYSYGTAIGASYLDQFPTRVRAMVLDGALDPTLTWDQLLAGQSQGFDVALKAFLADCQRTRCAFREAVSGDLTAAYDRLAASVETTPLPGDGTRTVGPGEFSYGVGAGLYSKRYGWPAIANALAAAEQGQGDGLLALSDSYLERSDTGYTNISEANFAVNCIDRPWPRTDAPYQALARRVAQRYPRFGPAIALSGLGCAVWPLKPVGTPHAVSAPGSPPVLVIGTTRDPATPYAWAVSLARQLSRGVLLTHEGDGHTVYRVGAPSCVLGPVDAYLLRLQTPTPARC
ncbi:MAG: alpha/beta hydrolase [Mycobacteriales bacterium]